MPSPSRSTGTSSSTSKSSYARPGRQATAGYDALGNVGRVVRKEGRTPKRCVKESQLLPAMRHEHTPAITECGGCVMVLDHS